MIRNNWVHVNNSLIGDPLKTHWRPTCLIGDPSKTDMPDRRPIWNWKPDRRLTWLIKDSPDRSWTVIRDLTLFKKINTKHKVCKNKYIWFMRLESDWTTQPCWSSSGLRRCVLVSNQECRSLMDLRWSMSVSDGSPLDQASWFPMILR